MSTTTSAVTTQVYRVYIKATPQQVWDAITKPEWTDRYGYGGLANYDLRPGAPYQVAPGEAMKTSGAENGYHIPDTIVDSEVVEADPPRKFVQTWRMLMDDELAAEGFTTITYELQDLGGSCKLTLVHELANAPKLAALVAGENEEQGAGGGWAWVLSDLKSLLETGSPLAG